MDSTSLKKPYTKPRIILRPKLNSKSKRPLVLLPDGTFAVMLTQGRFARIDAQDAEKVGRYNWCANGHYAVRYSQREDGSGTLRRLHREVMEPPSGLDVDHINGDGFDNRRANLRVCTRKDNTRNRRMVRANTSGFKGVSYHKACRRWIATIRPGGITTHIGVFSTPEAAAHAYDKAARKYFGEFAALNFPQEGERKA